jgi:hypothetical protein
MIFCVWYLNSRVGGPGFGGPGFSPQLGQVPGGLRWRDSRFTHSRSLAVQFRGKRIWPHFELKWSGWQTSLFLFHNNSVLLDRTMPQPQVGYSAAQGSPMGWRPMGGPGLGTPPQAGPSPYGALVSLRGGPATGVPPIVCFRSSTNDCPASCEFELANITSESSHCFQKGNRNSGCRLCIMVCPSFWEDYYMLIYTHCWELMNSVGSHGSLSLPFVMKVMVCHFVSDSHEVMTALIVALP